MRHEAWNYDFHDFEIPDTPFNEIYLRHSEYLKSLTHKEEQLTATWCISNQVPLKNKRNNQSWLTINYEEPLANPPKSMTRILDSWGINDYDFDKLNITNASKTTKAGSPIKGTAQIEFWKKNLNNDQVSRMSDVLNYFEIDTCSSSPYPSKVFNYG